METNHTPKKEGRVDVRVKRRKAALLKALSASRGVVSYACKKANVSRRVYYDYLNTDPDFERQVEEIKEAQVDTVEVALLNAITEGNITAIIFYLKTQGKHRGYIEKSEIRATVETGDNDLLENIPVEKREQVAEILLGLNGDK